ncbi:MAG: hypothetical protein GTN89_12005 [Acidobacteria bacterium]|nr:hypothetical protein [Acidobacteriota bacterium]NIM61028.1 hypothetical protein [Acidobacteriota bacterium]NIO59996.1 hypothetical protein [Acidobacteriota bacterium]NIQ31068.1 hypothetical protein [Acidobacteriota bacterium]NIQ86196.1 hypothetical protein [Acidobacteriota bacterium]
MLRLAGLWGPCVGFMACVWFLSDSVRIDTPELVSDKILHFVAYGLFGAFNLRAFHGGFRRPAPWATVMAMTLTAGFAGLDEWRQSGVLFRTASWGDWYADLAGALVALVVLRVLPLPETVGESRKS